LDQDLALISWILVALTAPLLLGVLALTARRVAIRRPGGAVTCSLRRDGELRWRRGVAAYRTGQLAWFPELGVRLRPHLVVSRQSLRLAERRVVGAGTGETADRVLPVGTAVARFETPEQPIWLAMSQGALTGLLAWVEAAPQRWPV
jgi:hypothetical protein